MVDNKVFVCGCSFGRGEDVMVCGDKYMYNDDYKVWLCDDCRGSDGRR